ncbi:MAG TPA: TCR/Tet family MFS transporter [Hyphomicrobiaceae bacterium]|jgi:DHA1 family tetracycline resistance protein-like MFS transporter|nr:TCR/Tet family MFS transporter [Hyphomicrobiaceae bacterium]
MQKPVPGAERRKAAIAFIFAIVLLDVIALGIVIPVLPKLVESMVGETARGAEIFGLFGTAWALMQFLCSPLLGALSDRFGRRPVLLISMAGHGLDYILMALAPNLLWLFVGRVISGITAASFGTAYAYIADVTTPEKRAQSFGVVGAAFGVGFVLGPALGGILGAYDPRLPFWVAAAFSLANAAYGYLFVPESLPEDRRMAFSLARANPVGSLRLLRQRPELLGLAGVNFLHQLAHASLPAIAVLYTSYRYGWDSQTMGLSLAAIGIMSGLVQGTLIKPIVAHVGERWTLLAGLLFGAAGFAIYGFARTSVEFWAGIPVMALWGIAGAATQAMMSQLVTPSEQGQLQGANASIMAVAGLFGPGLFSFTFAWSIARGEAAGWPGLAFLLAAALLVLATALAWQVTRTAEVSEPGAN